MKIMQVITALNGGGAEKFVIDLSNELSKNNEVILCTLYDINETMFLAKALNKNVRIITLNKQLGLDWKIFTRLNKVINEEKPDVVNTHLRALFYSSLPILFRRVNFFHTVHNMADKETSYVFRNIYKLFFRYFNVVPIAISTKVLESIHKEYSSKFNVMIENGVNKVDLSSQVDSVTSEINSYKVTKKTKVLLTIGRISKQKNYTLLIKTVNKLVDEGFDVILLVVGADHGELTYLKTIACNRVHFLGVKTNVIDYIYNADAFCLSSLYEGMPIVLLEALSMGCIPVCTPAGGVVDIITSDIGFLSNGFSESLYYKELRSFLSASNTDIKNMQDNCKKLFISKYNITKTAENYYNTYKQKIYNG